VPSPAMDFRSTPLTGKVRCWFLRASGSALAVTGFVKLVLVTQKLRLLDYDDPVFAVVTIRTALVAAAVLELGVSVVLFSRRWERAAPAILAWLCAVFSAYRIGLLIVGYHGPCWCLGGPFKWLGLSAGATDRVALGILAFMCLGSVSVLTSGLIQRMLARPAEPA
jgi:hypothetical protein